jgi:hypothetical protein
VGHFFVAFVSAEFFPFSRGQGISGYHRDGYKRDEAKFECFFHDVDLLAKMLSVSCGCLYHKSPPKRPVKMTRSFTPFHLKHAARAFEPAVRQVELLCMLWVSVSITVRGHLLN